MIHLNDNGNRWIIFTQIKDNSFPFRDTFKCSYNFTREWSVHNVIHYFKYFRIFKKHFSSVSKKQYANLKIIVRVDKK